MSTVCTFQIDTKTTFTFPFLFPDWQFKEEKREGVDRHEELLQWHPTQQSGHDQHSQGGNQG